MTNLPITSNNTQSPTKGIPVSAHPPHSDSDNTASTSQANSAVEDPAAKFFSVLLAKQIGEAGLSAQTTAAVDSNASAHGAGQTAKKVQDQTNIAPVTSSDPTNSLIGMLHVPVQVVNDIEQNRSTPLIKAANGIRQNIENNLQRTSSKPTEADNVLITTDDMQPTTPSLILFPSSDAVKHVGAAISTMSQTQTIPIITKTLAPTMSSEATSAMIPNSHISNNPLITQQTITTPLNNSGWADEFSQKIVWMNTQQNQIAELHLNPPDLGPLNVVLQFSDNQVNALFTSPHGTVRDAIENALPKLREMLADNNIMLGNATVSDQPPHDRSAEGFMNQGSGSTSQREALYNTNNSDELLSTTTQSIPVRRHNGMLDTFA